MLKKAKTKRPKRKRKMTSQTLAVVLVNNPKTRVEVIVLAEVKVKIIKKVEEEV